MTAATAHVGVLIVNAEFLFFKIAYFHNYFISEESKKKKNGWWAGGGDFTGV